MKASNFLVTGAGSGLGYEAVKHLIKGGAKQIFITTTSAVTAQEAAQLLALGTTCRVHGLALNLASRTSIASFAENLERLLGEGSLDGVALNAGTQIVSDLKRNEDGHELTIAVNHFGHLRLLFRLWNGISLGARIVLIGSATHLAEDRLARLSGFRGARFTSTAQWADGAGDEGRSTAGQGLDRYANSKLANIMTALELGRRVPASRVRFYALDPGLMPGTGLARNHSLFERIAWQGLRLLIPLLPGASTAGQSARVMADMLLGSYDASGGIPYLDFKGRPAPMSPTARDPQVAGQMLDQSLELLGLNPEALQS